MAAALALAFLAASPADAAKKTRKHQRHAGTARAVIVVHPQYRGAHLFPPGPIFYGNQYLGNDPDPFIRLQILRDLDAHFGGPD